MAVEDRVDPRPQLRFVQPQMGPMSSVFPNGTGPGFFLALRFLACPRHRARSLA
jgi:hypothetical protein